MSATDPTLAALDAFIFARTGRHLGDPIPRPVQTTEEWERECREAERGQERAEARMFAQPYEMDGAAADAWYGRECDGGDWRNP